MSLIAIKDDLNDALGSGVKESAPKKQTIEQRFDQLAEFILLNADNIMQRRLSGDKVDRSETENQELLQRDLKVMSQTIHLMKKHGRLPDASHDDTFDEESIKSVLEKVKGKKGSLANINQKIG